MKFVEALDFAAARGVVLPDQYYGNPDLTSRRLTTTVSGMAQLEEIQHVIDQVNKSISDGGLFKQFKADVAAGKISVDLSNAHLDNIFRTNIQTAYNQGRYAQLMQSSLMTYWMYDAILDGRVRPTHLAWSGTVLHREHPFWTTHFPPCGYRCRCRVIGLTPDQAAERGITKDSDVSLSAADSGFGGDPAAVNTRYVGLLNKKLTASDVPAVEARRIDQAATTELSGRQAIGKALTDLSDTDKSQLIAAAKATDQDDVLGVRLVQQYAKGAGARVDTALLTDGAAWAIPTVIKSLKSVAKAAPNLASVFVSLSQVDLLQLSVGTVFDLAKSQMAAVAATKAVVQLDGGGIDLRRAGLGGGVLLTIGEAYEVVMIDVGAGMTTVRAIPTARPPSITIKGL